MSVPILTGIKSEKITTSRLSTRVLFAGDEKGIPVLFLHGNVSSVTWWEETMLALPEEYLGIAPDQRGFGDADIEKKIDATDGMGDLARDAAALLDHLKIDRAHIAGNSLGGMVVRVESLTVYNRAPLDALRSIVTYDDVVDVAKGFEAPSRYTWNLIEYGGGGVASWDRTEIVELQWLSCDPHDPLNNLLAIPSGAVIDEVPYDEYGRQLQGYMRATSELWTGVDDFNAVISPAEGDPEAVSRTRAFLAALAPTLDAPA